MLDISPGSAKSITSRRLNTADTGKLERKLAPGQAGEARLSLNEAQFRWLSNEDAMATEKLAEGIRQFARDQEKLEALLQAKL